MANVKNASTSVYRNHSSVQLHYRGMRDFMERTAGRVYPNRDSRKARARYYSKLELYREAVQALDRALEWFDYEVDCGYCTEHEYAQLVRGSRDAFDQYIRKYC